MSTETQIIPINHHLTIMQILPWLQITALVAVIIALVIILFFIAGIEISYNLIPHSTWLDPANSGKKRNKLLVKMLTRADRLKATIIITNIFIKISIIGVLFIIMQSSIFANPGSVLDYTFEIVIITVFLYLAGDIIPKVIAQAHPYNYSLWSAYPLFFFFVILRPISFLLTGILKLSTVSQTTSQSQISSDDLSDAIEFASNKLTDEDHLLKGIVKFGNINVSEIIKPRVDVVAIEYNQLFSEVFVIVVDSEYSRIPVYSGNFDNIRGILYVKDLLPYLKEKDTFRWQALIRPPYFVPETKKVKELLTEFQTNKIHMAIIVDEYGGTIGIVTLEDILEEIVGEISDESDDDEKSYIKINDNTYIFDGKTLLNDFHKIIQSDPEVFDEIKGEADTLAGIILELKGAIPDKNEQITYKQFLFKIEAADSRRIKQIRVTILPGD